MASDDQEKKLDESRANQALGALSTNSTNSDAPKQIAVKKEAVDIIVAELEVTEDEATEALREAAVGGSNGNTLEGEKLVAAALRILVRS